MKSPYIKATLDFSEFNLGDLGGLNLLFQSKRYQLRALLPELERVLKMFHKNLMKISDKEKLLNVDVENEHKWVP